MKEEIPKKNDKTNFWHTLRGKAIIKLGLWTIFFAILFILAASGGKPNKKVEDNANKQFVALDTMIENLAKGNYEFNYHINVKDKNYIYIGKTDGTETIGTKETIDGITKYCIKTEGIFKIVMDKLEPLDNLYEDLNTKYFDAKTLVNCLDKIDYHVEKDNDKRKIIYDNGIVIETDLFNINSIKINEDNINYELNFKNISNVEKITL